MQDYFFPVLIQKSAKSCGPTSLKMVAQFYGKDYSIEYLCDVCGMTGEGVSLYGLSKCAEKIGLQSQAIQCTIDDLKRHIPLPAIAFWEGHHFIVVYDVNEKYIRISDPAKGYREYSFSEFKNGWCRDKKEGILLVFNNNETFCIN